MTQTRLLHPLGPKPIMKSAFLRMTQSQDITTCDVFRRQQKDIATTELKSSLNYSNREKLQTVKQYLFYHSFVLSISFIIFCLLYFILRKKIQFNSIPISFC